MEKMELRSRGKFLGLHSKEESVLWGLQSPGVAKICWAFANLCQSGQCKIPNGQRETLHHGTLGNYDILEKFETYSNLLAF